MFEARAENPRHTATGRVEYGVALGIDLEGKAVDQRNRDPRPHDGGVVTTEPVDTLQLSFAADAAKPGEHHLFAPNPNHALLIDKAPCVARLLDARLQLDEATWSRPPRIRRPGVSRRATAQRRLPDWRNRACDGAEIRRAVHVILTQVA